MRALSLSLALGLIATLIIGCARIPALYETVQPSEVKTKNAAAKLDNQYGGIWYAGSDERLHYLVIRYNGLPDRRYSIFKDAWTPAKRMEFLAPEATWERVDEQF